MQKAAEKILNKVIQEQLRPSAKVEETKEQVDSKTKKPLLNDQFEMKEYSEISSEINIDYLSDDCKQITQLLVDKFRTLLEENDMSDSEFRRLALTEQFQTIEDFQRNARNLKHEKLFEQN